MSQLDDFLNDKQPTNPDTIDSFLGDTPPEPASAVRKLGDLGLSLAKGVVAVPEAVVGLADIPTGGRVGRFLENKGGAIGFRPKEAKEILSSWQSDDLQGKQKQFQEADGVLGKAGVAITNPSLIANAVAESVPLMGAGAVPARALLAAAPRLGAVGAGAIGEGVAGAGSAAEAIRQETADGLLTPEQSALAAATGVATSAFGAAGGAVARRLGIADVDTALVNGTLQAGAAGASKGVLRRAAEGTVAEGFLEELPQSVAEQALQNVALDRPWQESLDAAAVMGTLSGGVMGGGAAALTRSPEQAPDPVQDAIRPPSPAVVPAAAPEAVAQPELKPSEAMGIDPAAGPLSRVAADAVDTGVTAVEQAKQAAAAAQAIDPADTPDAGTEPYPLAADPEPPAYQVQRYVDEMGMASPQMVAAKFQIPVERAQALMNQTGDMPADELFPLPQGQGAVDERTTDAVDGLAAGVGEPVGVDAAGGGSIAGFLADVGDIGGGVADGPGAAVPKDGPAPVAGQQRNDALSLEPTRVQDQPQAAADKRPKPAPAQATAVEAPPAVGSDGVAESGAAPAGSASVETAGVAAKKQEFKVEGSDPHTVSYAQRPDGRLVRTINYPDGQSSTETLVTDKKGDETWISNDRYAKGEFYPKQISPADAERAIREDMAGKPATQHLALAAAPAPAVPAGNAEPVVEHTTSKGKVLRGVVRQDMTLDQAKAIDPAAFRKGNGFFIREQHLDKLPAATTEPTNGTQAPQAQQATPQGREEAALLSDPVSTEPNFEAAKALLARQKAATGNAVAEGRLRKELRDLAAKTPQTDEKTVTALDIAATRLGMGDGRLKGLEFMPAAAPAVAQAQTPATAPANSAVQAPAVAAPGPAEDTPAARWTRMTTTERQGVAAASGMKTLPASNVSRKSWDGMDRIVQERLAKAMDKPVGQAAPAAPKNTWEVTGATDFREGKPRELPSYFTDKTGPNAKAWLRGWDAAKNAAPATATPAAAEPSPLVKELEANGQNDELDAEMRSYEDKLFRPSKEASEAWNNALEHYALSPYREAGAAYKRAFGEGYMRAFDGLDKYPSGRPAAELTALIDGHQFYRRTASDAPRAPASAPEAQQTVNAEGMARADVLQALEDGKVLVRFGDKVWIDRAKTGKSDTYVVKTQDAGSTSVFTKGPAGPDRSWGWGRGDAAREAIKSWEFEPAAAAPTPAPAPAAVEAQAPVASPAAAPAADALTEREKAAKAKMFGALGKLAALASKNTRMNWTPEEEQQLLPIVIELFDGAMELGAVKFKQAVAYVRDFIASGIDQETADAIPFETLQGAYIAVAGRHKDKPVTAKKEVAGFDSLDELNSQEENETPESTANGKPELRQDGAQPLDAAPAPEGSGAARAGDAGAGPADRGQPDAGTDSGPDGAGVPAPRGRGSRTGRVPDAAARGERVGGRRGAGRAGTRVPGNDARAPGAAGAVPAPVDDLFGADAESASAPNIPAANFKIEDSLALGEGGEVAKYRDNIAAIQTLKTIEAERRRATPEEQRILARFVGWGGVASAFPNPETKQFKDGWKEKGEQLRDLLTPSEYRRASASTRNAHYTSATVVKAMWGAVHRLGYRNGLALETSMGVGNFLGLMPANVNARFIGVEYDPLTARMAAALYPQATVLQSGFQEVPLPENVFDLSIGNPPFGDESLRFQFRPDLRGVSIHNQFFRASMSAVKPGGLQAMVVSRYLLDQQDRASRIALARDADLVAAIRLPDTAFKENARTVVVTDIIILRKRDAADKARMDAILDAYVKPKEKDFGKERERRELADQAPAWIETTEVPDPLGGEAMRVNSYFASNPGQVIGVLERSGSMRYKNDVTVRLDNPDTLGERLDALVAKLPENIVNTAADVAQATEENYRLLGEALSMAVNREEAGHIKFNEDGGLTRAVEREFGRNMVLSRQPLSAQSPWSKQLQLDDKGRWYKLEVKVDPAGNTLKVLDKDGKPTNRNLYDRTVYQSEADIPSGLRLGEAGFERLKGLVSMRDLLKRQLVLETEDAPKLMMEGNRTKLAAAYEAFVAQHGPINRRANAALVAEMPDGGLILALEEGYEPERTAAQAKKSGLPVQQESARPAPIMRERVVPKYEPPTQADTPADALAINLAERGVVDIERIANLLNITPEEAEAKLQEGEKPLIFKDPETNTFETANAYLSGPVRRKLMAAKAAGLQKNVAALEAIQPERWGAENVSVQIGAAWVPPDVYADFGAHLFGGQVKVSFSPLTNTFGVVATGNDQTKAEAWSTENAPGSWILSRLLNSQTPTVTYTDSEGKTHVDKEGTSLAILKGREMVAEFGDWIFKDGDRRERLVEIFNEKFNTRVTRQFDGSHLKLPGKVPDTIIKMRRHQMNAIWRGISSRFLLIDHVVGAGKTFTAIARAMERRRMGLAQKPAIVVPNHLIEQWQADVYKLYPGAKVLAATKADFEAKNRRKLFSRIATGDYDIVILPHSSLVKIGISPETEQRYLEQELADAIQAVKDAQEQAEDDGYAGFRKPMGVKEAERLVAKIEARMAKLREGATDRLLTFEQLGIDDLTVDEAHEFKNLFYSSRMTGTRGMGDKVGSRKAADLYNKVRVLRDNGGAVVFMTGTPVSNSVVELYTMMRYLASTDLRDMGMEHFDAWRSQFVDATPAFEPDESNRLKEVTRLGRTWSNMRSMMDLYYQFTDAVSIDDIKQWHAEDNKGKDFPVPKVKGGDRKLVKVLPTPAQDAMLKEVINGFDGLDDIKDPKERNAERLRLMDRARKLSLDARAADRLSMSTEKGGKLERLSAEVKRIYDKWTPERGTQLVFLDRSVPKAKGDDKIIKDYDALVAKRDKALADNDDEAFREHNEALEKFDAREVEELRNAQNGGWNAYQQIKDNLVASGVPADEIRFIQEANTDEQKQAMFDAVNGGKVRVLIGSTPRMGAGTNVQQRLVALHHADVNWKPSDIEQREGRIIRQGNRIGFDEDGNAIRPDFEVEILAYATERTVDAKMWSLNATKLKAINGLRKYTGDFTMEVEDEESVSMAEMAALASGNPLLLERVTLESAINGLELQERAFRRKMYGAQDALRSAQTVIESYPQQIEASRALSRTLAAQVQAVADRADARRVTVEGQEFASVKDAFKAVKAAVEEQQAGNENARYAVNIGGDRVTNKVAIEEAISRALGDAEAFEVELSGKTFTQRTAAGRELAATLSPLAAKANAKGELGTMFGMKLSYEFNPSRYESGKVDLLLVLEDGDGKAIASDDVSAHDPNIQFTTGKLRDMVGNLAAEVESKATGRSASNMESRLERARRDLLSLQERVKETFPKAGELKDKRARLQEVVTMLTTEAPAAAVAEDDEQDDAAGDLVLSQSLAPVAPGRGVSRQEAEDAVAKVLDGLGMRGVVVPQVLDNPRAAGLGVPAGVVPSGGTRAGQVYLFLEGIGDKTEAFRVAFHELFHLGLSQSVKPADYTQTMLQFLQDPLVRQYANRWKQSADGKSRQGKMTMNGWHALAVEEALADIAEEINVDREGLGSKDMQGWVKRSIAWLASLAQRWGLPDVAARLRKMTMTEAEAFVQATMLKGRTGAPVLLPDARFAQANDTDLVMRSPRNPVKEMTGKATDALRDMVTAPGKLSWWHKTVGTMYNLAERSPAFKRVFQAAQGFIDDVSYYATEAADLAPKILPKLEDWRDIGKSPISAADNKAIAAPIFEGTLSWTRGKNGKPVKMDDLVAAAANISADDKLQQLVRDDKLSPNVAAMWRALPIEQMEAMVETRYREQVLEKAGIVWTTAELKSMWNLTDEQVALYREFRSAADRSLDNLAKADMLRYVGEDGAGFKDAVMEAKDATEAANLLRDYVRGLAQTDVDREDALNETASGLLDRAARIEDLKKRGYAPLSRFGKYTVDAVVDGERQYFGLFETAADANKMAAKLRMEFGKDSVSQGTLSEESFKLFAGVTPETLELFGNMLGLSATGDEAQDQAFQAYLKLTKNNRSAMKRLMHRKGIAGYSEDVGRVLASFIYSNSRQTAAGVHMGELGEALQAIPQGQGELKDEAMRLADYIKNPQEEAQAIRGLLFAQYLGGSVASAFVNMTQPFAVSFPYLSQFGGAGKSAAALMKAMKDMAGSKAYEADLAQALKRAEEDGTVSPQEVHQLMAQARGAGTLRAGDGTRSGEAMATARNHWSRLTLAWGKVFGVAEQLNRRSTYIAAFRLARDQGMADPAGFAKKAVHETQFVYSKANKMRWGRGAVGGTVMTFKTYSIAYLELLHRMATQGGPEGRRAALLAVGVLMLMGGAGGLPFAEDAEDLADGIAQVFGYNFSAKKAKQEFLEDLFGRAGADFIERGVSGLPGSPLDVSGRLGMGNLVPGTGLFQQKTSYGRDLAELVGPVGDLGRRAMDATRMAVGGNLGGAALELSPVAIRNMAKGVDMLDKDMYRDAKGFKVLDTTPSEGVLKFLGFQPGGVAKVQEANYLNQRAKDFYNMTAQDIRGKWARGIFEKDQAMVDDARAELAAWNEKNPEQRMSANMPAILKRVREMAKSKDQRIADTAPKAMRQQMKEDTARLRESL